jgi:two-component system response regulator RegA
MTSQKRSQKVLIVEDDHGLLKVLTSDFKDRGFEVCAVNEIGGIPEGKFDYAVIDLRLNGESGLSVIHKLKEFNEGIKIVILTGFGSIATAIEAIKLGASDYLTKPAHFEQILSALENGAQVDVDHNIINEKRLSLSRNEYEYINYVLEQNKGNISQTAKELGLHRQSLQRKLKKNP